MVVPNLGSLIPPGDSAGIPRAYKYEEMRRISAFQFCCSCFVEHPQQFPVGGLDSLRGKRRRHLDLENLMQHVGFVRTARKEHDFGGAIEDGERQSNAVGVK